MVYGVMKYDLTRGYSLQEFRLSVSNGYNELSEGQGNDQAS